MERLTEYDEFGNAEFVGIDNTKLYGRLVCDETVALTIATNKLAEFEDFMEKYNVESMEDLELRLEDIEHYAYNCNVEQIDEIIKLKQENQALKDFNSRLQNINIELLNQKQILLDRWKKLKEFAKIEHDWGLDENYQDHSYAMKLVFDRMEELEKE